MKRLTALLVLAGSMGLAGTAVADETTFCNAFITTLPFTISTQGHYCFNKNLSTAITTGAAITINTDFVVLDLNNFKLGGGSAGFSTSASGIKAIQHSNLTIRNGNIRGFRRGIYIDGGTNHVIENNVLDGNTQYGVFLSGTDTGGDASPTGVLIRNNLVTNTGGSTLADYAYAIYDWSWQGASKGNMARDNTVSNVFSVGGTGDAVGINIRQADHNLINLGSATTTGNKWGTAGSYNRDNTVLYADTGYEFWQSYALIGHNYP
jgi:parallel beta-helix repeat protein